MKETIRIPLPPNDADYRVPSEEQKNLSPVEAAAESQTMNYWLLYWEIW